MAEFLVVRRPPPPVVSDDDIRELTDLLANTFAVMIKDERDGGVCLITTKQIDALRVAMATLWATAPADYCAPSALSGKDGNGGAA